MQLNQWSSGPSSEQMTSHRLDPPRIAVPLREGKATTDYNNLTIVQDFQYVFKACNQAIIQAGGIPVLIPPTSDPSIFLSLLESCDGLCMVGGENVDPAQYHQPPDKNHVYSPDVDTTDFFLFDYFKTHRSPILGICRGMQLINVASGGTLTTGPASHARADLPRDTPVHDLDIIPDTILANILSQETIRMNTLHQQVVGQVGNSLKVNARVRGEDPITGVVEGLEGTEPDHWLVALQGHPEILLTAEPSWTKLFSAFIQEASKVRHARSEVCPVTKSEAYHSDGLSTPSTTH